MKRIALPIILLLALFLAACRESPPTPTPEPEEPAEVAAEPTDTPEPEATDTPETEATDTPEPEPEPTDTPEPEEDAAAAESESGLPMANVINDEGGPVSITGVVTYTNPFFTAGVAEPVVILEDQAGFVERNESFLMPLASQTLGQITSDFFTSPFSYSISLPIEPQGTLSDVDNDEEEDTGVQVYAVAYWTNTFGDPFLEERDLSGGGWSTAYASTVVSDDAATEREIIGGKFLIYAPDDQQGFPSGFGEDGLLFTEDDPIVALPQGYSVVDLDADPFTFDRARDQVINLFEPESTALVDNSDLGYRAAFDALVDQLEKEYAFTEYKGIDWEALRDEFGPRFEEAEADDDVLEYRRALRDFAWSIPDAHISGPQVIEDFREDTTGGLGLAMRDVDDGRVIVNFVTPGGPAEEAGIELGAEILSINGVDVNEAIDNAVAHSAPFSTEHVERLQKLRYATRFPLDTEVELIYRNPGEAVNTVTLTAVDEPVSFAFSSFNVGRTGFEQPVEYDFMEDSGYGYVQIYSFFDNELLTVQLWERLMQNLNENGVPGLVVDMRRNGGGSGFLADQMAAYFFEESHVLGNTGRYDEELDDFYFDPRSEQRFYLPAEELRYDGEVAVIVGPNCASACEFFSYDMTVDDRATIVGHYPTAGAGGSIEDVLMPEGHFFRFTQGRAVNADGEIHIEGIGVIPDVQVPVTEETLFSDGDPLLEAAIAHLDEALTTEIVDGGVVALGDEVEGTLEPETRVRYTLVLAEGDVLDVILESDDFEAVLGLYDDEGSLLGTTEGEEAIFEELEIPFDLTLLVEIAAAGDEEGGDYTLRIVDTSE